MLGREWEYREKALLREIYETATQLDIMEVLPNRTWGSISGAATGMGLRRQKRQKELIRDHLVCLSDLRFFRGERLDV